WPDVEWVQVFAIVSALDGRVLDSAAARADRLASSSTDPVMRAHAAEFLAIVALQRGQPAVAERRLVEWRLSRRASGDPDAPLADAVFLARAELWTREAPGEAVARLDAAFIAQPV